MPALMSLDCEYTHPSPQVGEIMQLGAKIIRYDFDKMERTPDDNDYFEIDTLFPVHKSLMYASDWVRENQSGLYGKCLDLSRKTTLSKVRAQLVLDLEKAVDRYGGPIVVCGWDIASDMAYLLHVLGSHHHLVHYVAIDITSMLIGATGSFNPTMDEIKNKFDFHAKNMKAHDALSDARFQLDLALAVIEGTKRDVEKPA